MVLGVEGVEVDADWGDVRVWALWFLLLLLLLLVFFWLVQLLGGGELEVGVWVIMLGLLLWVAPGWRAGGRHAGPGHV